MANQPSQQLTAAAAVPAASTTITSSSDVPRATTGEKKQQKQVLHKFFEGSFSGVAGAVILQPLDVIKTNQQGAVKLKGQADNSLGLFRVGRNVVEAHGVQGLWRGVGPSSLRVFFGVGIYFTTLDTLLTMGQGGSAKQADKHNKSFTGSSTASSLVTFLAGSTARITAATIVNPITLVKTRFEWAAGGDMVKSGIFGTLRTVVQQDGFKGLYRGLGATIARDAPYSGLYVTFYSNLQQHFPRATGLPVDVSNFFVAALSAAAATTVTHPADVIKTRQQLPMYGGTILQTTQRMFQLEGWQAFFRGLFPRMIKRSLSSAVTWTTYEAIRRWNRGL